MITFNKGRNLKFNLSNFTTNSKNHRQENCTLFLKNMRKTSKKSLKQVRYPFKMILPNRNYIILPNVKEDKVIYVAPNWQSKRSHDNRASR